MIVIDNFFEDPQKVISISEEYEYTRYLQGDRTPDLQNDFAIECITKVLKEMHPKTNFQIFNYGVSFCKSDPNYVHGTPHQDTGITCIVYLNEGIVDGTSVFDSPKETIIETRSERLQAIESFDYGKYNQLAKEYTSQYKRTLKVDGKFNRAFMFDGNNYHAADGFSKDKKGNKRLTLLIRIREFQIVE